MPSLLWRGDPATRVTARARGDPRQATANPLDVKALYQILIERVAKRRDVIELFVKLVGVMA